MYRKMADRQVFILIRGKRQLLGVACQHPRDPALRGKPRACHACSVVTGCEILLPAGQAGRDSPQ